MPKADKRPRYIVDKRPEGKRPWYIGTIEIKSRTINQNPKFHTPHHQASARKPPERREPGPIGINNAYKVANLFEHLDD